REQLVGERHAVRRRRRGGRGARTGAEVCSAASAAGCEQRSGRRQRDQFRQFHDSSGSRCLFPDRGGARVVWLVTWGVARFLSSGGLNGSRSVAASQTAGGVKAFRSPSGARSVEAR